MSNTAQPSRPLSRPRNYLTVMDHKDSIQRPPQGLKTSRSKTVYAAPCFCKVLLSTLIYRRTKGQSRLILLFYSIHGHLKMLLNLKGRYIYLVTPTCIGRELGKATKVFHAQTSVPEAEKLNLLAHSRKQRNMYLGSAKGCWK
jgi:hypothetical protein